MFYDFALVVPANTPQDTPAEQTVKLTHGVITYAEVEFHPGCNGMVEAYVRHGLHQLFPTNPDSRIKTDGRAIGWRDYYELFFEPYKLVIGGYSPGTTYDHELIFRFEVTPKDIAERDKLQAGVLTSILKLLGVRK